MHIDMLKYINILKRAAREREISDERDALLTSSRFRSEGGTGATLNVSAATHHQRLQGPSLKNSTVAIEEKDFLICIKKITRRQNKIQISS